MEKFEQLVNLMGQFLPVVSKLSEMLPDLHSMQAFYQEQMEKKREEEQSVSAIAKEIEAWKQRVQEEQKSNEDYSHNLERHFATGHHQQTMIY